jgi:hypothetical protein
MIRTRRGKRDLNVGAQPVVQGVKHVNNVVCVISENAKMRGDMTNLKKMLLPNVKSKVKQGTSIALQHGVMLCFGGVDSINLHFAGVPIHTHFVEFVLIAKPGAQPRFDLAVSQGVQDIIVKGFNDMLIDMAGDESCVVTRKILSDWKAEGGIGGDYFTLKTVSPDRHLIHFNYNIDASQKESQPFIEVRVLADLKVSPFESDGIYFLPFGSVVRDINVMSASVGGPDWIYRSDCLKECLARTNTSLSYFAFQAMLRICFPGVTMLKMGVKESVVALVTEAVFNAPQNHGGTLTALKTELLREIDLTSNTPKLAETVTFENFVRRARILGLIPEVDMRTGDIITNAYNMTTFEEFKKVNLK